MKNNKASAFSLIELSIVILIIGILVAGVTQSTRLVAKMRVSSAKAQTQSSAAASIKNMIFWLETTSDKSFDDIASDDGVAISSSYKWYDINPQLSQRSNASGATGPNYKSSCINNLPCLKFNGSTQFLDVTQTNGLPAQLSVFVVFTNLSLPSTSGTAQSLLSVNTLHDLASSSFQFHINATNRGEYAYYTSAGVSSTLQTNAITANLPYIMDVVDDGVGSQSISLSTPGTGMVRTSAGATNPTSSKNLNSTLNIGSWNNGTVRARYFNGYIAEVIVFDRALKNEERSSIESYLGKKWGIKI